MHLLRIGVVLAVLAGLAAPALCARRALLYDGAAADDDSADALRELLGGLGYEVHTVSRLDRIPPLLAQTELLVIGGTDDDLTPILRQVRPPIRSAVAQWVEGGGAYLGICGGAVMGGASWEEDGALQHTLELAPVEIGEITQSVESRVIPVTWGGQSVPLFFQNGPCFAPDVSVDPGRLATVARYASGQVAALEYQRGRGRVVLIGPHPEATADWIEPATPGGKTWRDSRPLLRDLLDKRQR